MIDEYDVAASSPMNSLFHFWMYWIGIVTPTGIARAETPTTTPSTRRGECFVIVDVPAIVVKPRPIEKRIADSPRSWMSWLTRLLSAIGMPWVLANWLL